MTGYPECEFDALAARIRAEGDAQPDNLLQASVRRNTLLCRNCGELPWVTQPLPNTEDWAVLCQRAISHAFETGHKVIADSWNAAVYGREL